MTLMDKSK